MSVHPYEQKYVEEVMSGLGDIFDLALRQKSMSAKDFQDMFATSMVATLIEKGSLNYIDGCSAQESLSRITGYDVVQTEAIDYGAEYWAGFILAYLQWEVNRSFEFILGRISLYELLSMHHMYHEVSEKAAVEELKKRLDLKSPLLERRLQLGFTQQELAEFSGVNVRNIRAYEQGQNELCKASGEILYNLSRSLGCSIEFLLVGS